MGDTTVYHRGVLMHVPFANSTLLCSCRNHSNLDFLQFGLAHVGHAVRGFDPLFDPFSIWGNELSMNISQVKKLRKIVRMKKLATNNSKIFVCAIKKTSVNYRMVPTLLPYFYPLRHFKIYNSDLCIALFSVLLKAVHR